METVSLRRSPQPIGTNDSCRYPSRAHSDLSPMRQRRPTSEAQEGGTVSYDYYRSHDYDDS
jgi:hypothetical protein